MKKEMKSDHKDEKDQRKKGKDVSGAFVSFLLIRTKIKKEKRIQISFIM